MLKLDTGKRLYQMHTPCPEQIARILYRVYGVQISTPTHRWRISMAEIEERCEQIAIERAARPPERVAEGKFCRPCGKDLPATPDKETMRKRRA